MLSTLALFQNMGLPELLVILFIVLLLFGSTKLPALARSLGTSVNEFKKGTRDSNPEAGGESKDPPSKGPGPESSHKN